MLRPSFFLSALLSFFLFAVSTAYSSADVTSEDVPVITEVIEATPSDDEAQTDDNIETDSTTKIESVAPDYFAEPGLTGQREYKNDHLHEFIDPFTGFLHLDQVDLRLPGNGGMDIVLRRVYHNYRNDQIDPRGEFFLGFGWHMHFGRVLKPTENICVKFYADNPVDENPVLELPDGSRLPFYPANDNHPGITFLTKNWWRAECLYEGDNPAGLMVYSPDGVKYTMNRRGIGRILRLESRDVYSWYTTKIEDTNGNVIEISYDSNASGEYTRITKVKGIDNRENPDDPTNREVLFEYTTSTVDENGLPTAPLEMNSDRMEWLRLNRITANPQSTDNKKVLQYHYITPDYVHQETGFCFGVCWLLSEVTPQSGEKDSWFYEYKKDVQPGGCEPAGPKPQDVKALPCDELGKLSVTKVTYPTGGTVSYTYRAHPITYQVVIGKKIADSEPATPELEGGGMWEYFFPEPNDDFQRPDWDKTVIKLPSGGEEVYDHNLPAVSWLEGFLKEKIIRDSNGNELSKEVYSWDKVLFSNYASGSFLDAKPGNHTYLIQKATYLDGANKPYITEYKDQDKYGNPLTVVEKDANYEAHQDWQRTTTYTYFENTENWIINRVEDELISGEILPAHDRTFDQTTGNLLFDSVFGIGSTYARNVYGEIETSTDGRGYVTEYYDYYRGLPRCVIKPVSITDLTVNSSDCTVAEDPQTYIKNTREVDYYGNVRSYTNGRSYTTGFNYDALNRLSDINYPINDPVSIIWNANNSVLTRGVYQETTTYDGFGRETFKVNNHRATNKTYDALGNVVESYLPNEPIYVPHSYDRFEYDELNRVVTVTHPDDTQLQYNYQPLGKVLVTDERGFNRLLSYRALGDVVNKELMQIEADVRQDGGTMIKQITDIERDVLGHTTAVTQNGIQRTYSYNDKQQLEIIIEPELAYQPRVFGYDDSGNMNSEQIGTLEPIIYAYDGQNRRFLTDYPSYVSGDEIADTHDVSTTYDANNNIRFVDNGISVREYQYDENDNLSIEKLSIDSLTFLVNYEYNSLDYLKTRTYPNSNRLTGIDPDPVGQPTRLWYMDKPEQYTNIIDTAVHWPNGVPSKIAFHNGVYTCTTLNVRQWVEFHYTLDLDLCVGGSKPLGQSKTQLSVQEISSQTVDRLREAISIEADGFATTYQYYVYWYYGDGNIKTVKDMKHDTADYEQYGYDGIGRLTSVTNHYIWNNSNYSYDLDGDILSSAVGDSTVSYTYNSAVPSNNRLVSVNITGVDYSFSYDAHGNTKEDGRYRYQYDHANNLVSVRELNQTLPYFNHRYTYDGNNQRIKKDNDGQVTYYFYDHAGQLLGEYNSAGQWKREYFYLGNTQVAEILNKGASVNTGEQITVDGITIRSGEYRAYDATTSIAVTNVTVRSGGTLHLKAPTVRLGENFIVEEGGSLSSGENTVFEEGEVITYLHADLLGSPRSASNQEASELWEEEYEPYGKRFLVEDSSSPWYTGKYEEDTGLLYYGARWYNPQIGRFYSLDPVLYTESNVHSFNRFAYANNNPYKYVDPDGNNPIAFIAGILYGIDYGLSLLDGIDAYESETSVFDEGISSDGLKAAAGTAAVALATSIGKPGSNLGRHAIESVTKSALPKHSWHSLNQKINREVKTSDELDAIRNPLDKRPVKYDSQGRPSQRSVGKKAEVAVNTDTNTIVSVNPTSSKKAARLQRRNEQNQ